MVGTLEGISTCTLQRCVFRLPYGKRKVTPGFIYVYRTCGRVSPDTATPLTPHAAHPRAADDTARVRLSGLRFSRISRCSFPPLPRATPLSASSTFSTSFHCQSVWCRARGAGHQLRMKKDLKSKVTPFKDTLERACVPRSTVCKAAHREKCSQMRDGMSGRLYRIAQSNASTHGIKHRNTHNTSILLLQLQARTQTSSIV